MNNKEKNKKNKSLLISMIILIGLIIIIAGVAIYYVSKDEEKDDKTLAYTDLIKEISYGNVEKIKMTVGSTSIKVKMKDNEEEKKSIVPNTEAFIELVQHKVS